MSNEPTTTLGEPAGKELLTYVEPTYDKFGNAVYETTCYPKDVDAIVKCLYYPDHVIPVVFVPGVMGSNIRSTGTRKAKIWNLNSNLGLAHDWVLKDAAQRKELLDPTLTEVDDRGKIDDDNEKELRFFATRKERGWGSVGYDSYADFLVWLQEALHDFDNCGKGIRHQLIGKNLDAEIAEHALSEAEATASYNYLFPVHAVGYNWLQSNEDSAIYLQQQVEQIIKSYKNKKKHCEQVILVTHSMGGLVARQYTQKTGGESQVAGVIHGVLPAIGAPAVYRRMKAGTEHRDWNLISIASSKVLGGSADTMTAVLAQSPGPIQLLPSKAYGMNWLKIKDGAKSYTFPKTDPYKEIYLNREAWWGLCEEKLINPEKSTQQAQWDRDWTSYQNMMTRKVKPFIEGLTNQYHPITYSFYGNSEDFLAFGEVCWQGDTGTIEGMLYDEDERLPLKATKYEDFDPLDGQLHAHRVVKTPVKQSVSHKEIQQRFELSGPNTPGDSTVPISSGKIDSQFLQSRLAVSVDHEAAFRESDTARLFTLRAIVKLSSQIRFKD